jgi:AcrR family transcriptional regulator
LLFIVDDHKLIDSMSEVPNEDLTKGFRLINLMTQPRKRSPGRPRSLQSQQSILRAANELLREVGYERMSIEGIAARAGVGKTTIYRWYESKEELVTDALTYFRRDLPVPDTGTLWTDLEAMFLEITRIDPNAYDRHTLALTIGSIASSPLLAEVYWANYIAPRRVAISVIFDRAKARGELRADADPELILDIILASVFVISVIKPNKEATIPYVHRVLDQIIIGFGQATSAPKS